MSIHDNQPTLVLDDEEKINTKPKSAPQASMFRKSHDSIDSIIEPHIDKIKRVQPNLVEFKNSRTLFSILSKRLGKRQDIFEEIEKNMELVGEKIQVSLQLPKLIVVGVESSGKSSVLERLVGKRLFPKGQHLTTQMPIKLHMFRKNEWKHKFRLGLFECNTMF
jgi:hypothetical protein